MTPNAQPTRVESFDRSALAQLLEPPYTDPYVRWCGRGGAARLPPIPICGTFETCRLRRAMSEFEGQSGKHVLVLSSSQFDPSRKSATPQRFLIGPVPTSSKRRVWTVTMTHSDPFWRGHAATRVHRCHRQCCCVSASGAGAATGEDETDRDGSPDRKGRQH